MHMADALLSPAAGGVMWALSAGTIGLCSRRVRQELDERKIPLMGVLGAFIFAAQMINFTIPGTGSSGHLGGGLLLAILLGPHAAFLTIASVLVVQALFFADGGLLALGCNIFNLGVFPAFIAYPFIYRRLAGNNSGRFRTTVVTVVAAVVGLQFGALAVVLETAFSGASNLPIPTFLLLMLPIHLAIGIIEGFVTAAVVAFVRSARPEMVEPCGVEVRGSSGFRVVVGGFLVAAFVTAGGLSWFASEKPDGLEWAIERISGAGEVTTPEQGIHGALARLQERLAIFPDYTVKKQHSQTVNKDGTEPGETKDGTGLSGIVGGIVTLLFAGLIGVLLKRGSRNASHPPD